MIVEGQVILPDPVGEQNPGHIPIQPPGRSSATRITFNRIDFVDGPVGFHNGPQKRSGLKLALWTWLSAGIDTLVLVSMSCFFMIVFSFLMQTSAKKVITSFIHQPALSHLFIGFFLVSFWLYLITMRLFMGASIGEWTCNLRLGQPSQRNQVGYVLRVMARTSLVLFTGIVVLPLFSLLFKCDLVGDMAGIKIYSLK